MGSHDSWIARVAAVALDRFDDTIALLGLSGGKHQGPEYLALNPRRPDKSPGSFSINADTGSWGDFAIGVKGRDLVSLAAYLLDEKNGEAGRWLASRLGVAVPSRKEGQAGDAPPLGGGMMPLAPEKSHGGPDSCPAGRAKANSAGEIVLPVPDDAPPPPKVHPKLGSPARSWEYRDAAGRLLFLVCRFELAGGGKDIRPLSLRRMPSGRLEWRWLGAAPPRALYGLDHLAARSGAPVMICEGEKAADAAAVLFPDHVAVTSPNGAKAADKADWSPLAGRECVLFPDADEAGEGYAAEVCRCLHQVGAAVVRRLAPAFFLVLPDGMGRECLPDGWDGADALAEGYTAEWVAARRAGIEGGAFEDFHQVPAGGAPSGNERDEAAPARPHFNLDARGVWFVGTDREGTPTPPRWVCGPLEVLAMVRDPSNRGWGKLVSFRDPDGVDHREIVADTLLCGDGAELERLLRSLGLQIAPKGRASLLEYLITQRPRQRARITPRTGWHEGADGLAFVLPDRAIGEAGEVWLFEADASAHAFKQRGALDDWRQEVAARCAGNSRLIFALCTAFASPLLYLAGAESGGFHLRSNSSDGKTTALRVAASVCGGPDYMQRWRATDNGLEVLAMQHCDAPLLLDELAQLDPKAAGEVAYMLANGAGKARAGRVGGLREMPRWRLLFLSAGEIGLSQHMAEAGKQTKAGQELRLAELPADAGAGLGVFECLHDAANGADFARALDRATRHAYGTAFPAFLAELVKRPQVEVVDTLREARRVFERHHLTDDASGQARRVADRFGLVGAAGELASQWGITGWAAGEAMRAAGVCFAAWLGNRGGEGSQEERAALAQVRAYLHRNGEANFTDWDRPGNKTELHAQAKAMRSGFRRHDAVTDATEYFVFNSAFREHVCKGLDAGMVGRLLVARGYAEQGTEKDRPWLVKEALPTEGRQRVVHILPALFEADDA